MHCVRKFSSLLFLTNSIKLESKSYCMAGYLEERAVIKILTNIDYIHAHVHGVNSFLWAELKKLQFFFKFDFKPGCQKLLCYRYFVDYWQNFLISKYIFYFIFELMALLALNLICSVHSYDRENSIHSMSVPKEVLTNIPCSSRSDYQ